MLREEHMINSREPNGFNHDTKGENYEQYQVPYENKKDSSFLNKIRDLIK